MLLILSPSLPLQYSLLQVKIHCGRFKLPWQIHNRKIHNRIVNAGLSRFNCIRNLSHAGSHVQLIPVLLCAFSLNVASNSIACIASGQNTGILILVDKLQVSFSNVRYLILDEADRMLEMGFENDIRKIVTEFGMPEKTQRQTLMFSATFPDQIQKLAREYLNDYLFLAVGSVGGTNLDIKQEVLDVQGNQKRSVLMEILGQSSIVDFC